MKVRVSLTLDLDPDAWAREYGLADDEIRADVKVSVSELVYQHYGPDGLGLLNGVKLA